MNSKKYSYKILFVEDEKPLRDNYVTFLKRHFEVVYEAEDGALAYKIYKEKRPHILIVDINIPKLNGIDLLRKIREEDHTTKAIILTAHSDVEYLLNAVELKLTKYLVKPISRQELHDALNLVTEELSKFDVLSKQKVYFKEDFYFDIEMQELFDGNERIPLTNKESLFIAFLSSNPKLTFTYDEIIFNLWSDFDKSGGVDALKTIIKNLRRKLPKDTIKNIFGVGYKLEIS